MTVVEKVLLFGMASLLAGVTPALAYTRRRNLRPGNACKPSAAAVWSTNPEKQPCLT